MGARCESEQACVPGAPAPVPSAQVDGPAGLGDPARDGLCRDALAAPCEPVRQRAGRVVRRDDGRAHVLVARVEHAEHGADRPFRRVLLAEVVEHEDVALGVPRDGGLGAALVERGLHALEHALGGREGDVVAGLGEQPGHGGGGVRLAGADAPVYVEPGAPVARERGDVLGELGVVCLGGPVAPGDARARERLLPAGRLLLGGEGRAPSRLGLPLAGCALARAGGGRDPGDPARQRRAERIEGGAAVRAHPRLRLVEGEPGRPGLLQGDESRSVHRAPLPYLLKSLLSLLLIGWHIVRGFPVISSGVRAANPVISSPFRAGNPDESSGVASAPGGSLSRTMR